MRWAAALYLISFTPERRCKVFPFQKYCYTLLQGRELHFRRWQKPWWKQKVPELIYRRPVSLACWRPTGNKHQAEIYSLSKPINQWQYLSFVFKGAFAYCSDISLPLFSPLLFLQPARTPTGSKRRKGRNIISHLAPSFPLSISS